MRFRPKKHSACIEIVHSTSIVEKSIVCCIVSRRGAKKHRGLHRNPHRTRICSLLCNILGGPQRHVQNNYNFDDLENKWVEIIDRVVEQHGSWENRKNYDRWQLMEVA